MKNEAVKKFWENFCEINKINPETSYQSWHFDNSSEVAKELVESVLYGDKRATAMLFESAEIHPESAPIDGGYSVVTDFENNPMCVIRTTEIRQFPFDEVDAEFAFDEGEGDRSLEFWRKVHRRYFSEEAAKIGIEFNEKSVVICERFELLYP